MLIGQYEARIDNKGRIAFPKKLREVLDKKLIITFGYERSLIIVPQNRWKTLLEGTEKKSFIQKEVRETQRFLLGGASSLELDTKGRLLLPKYLREFGLIEKEIVFLGLYRYIELWDKKRWENYRGILKDTINIVSERLISQAKEVGGDE